MQEEIAWQACSAYKTYIWLISHCSSNQLLSQHLFPPLTFQFVPFRDYIDRTGNHILSMARLAKDVLAEIPDQFLSYMRTRGIKPSPAPPPYTPPGQPIQTQIWGARLEKVLESGVRWTCHAKYFHFLKAALHALWLWITVVFHVFRKLHAGPGEWRFWGQEKKMRVCLLPLSSIPVIVWIFFLPAYFMLGKILEKVQRVSIQIVAEIRKKEKQYKTADLTF